MPEDFRYFDDVSALPDREGFAFPGARALAVLHERELRSFIASWRRFVGSGLPLPVTDDPRYASRDLLLLHVLTVARRAVEWTADRVGRRDLVRLPEPPSPAEVGSGIDAYLDELMEVGRGVARVVSEEGMLEQVYVEPWQEHVSIESLMEHAVAHAMRHALQLDEIVARGAQAEHG